VVIPYLLEYGLGKKAKPMQKEMSLKLITFLAKKEPKPLSRQLVVLIPIVADLMWDVKKDVKQAAIHCMEAITLCTGNKDLDPFIPIVLKAIQEPTTVPDAIESLAGCIFVQAVEAPALAVTTPVLVRGLNERAEDKKRKVCTIIDNMCKLVQEPQEILPLMPQIEPLVKKAADSMADPECRKMAERAHKTLVKAAGQSQYVEMKFDEAERILVGCIDGTAPTPRMKKPIKCPGFDTTITYIGCLMASMTNGMCFDTADWTDSVTLFLNKFFPQDKSQDVMNAALEKCRVTLGGDETDFEDDDVEAKDLYKGVFSLAYGNLTLLNNTKWQLKRNKFYGLLGPNNCGKTTLMRAIAGEQIEGFPKRDELKTIFVEHEIQEREVGEDENRYVILNIDLNGIDWVLDTCNNVYNLNPKVTREKVTQVLEDIGFGNSARDFGKDRAADANMGVTTYSGGWKMKMQLCAATLMNADILMLDEPTGHLDVKNIAWIKQWLKDFMSGGGSIIATSHDTDFLNEMCNYIVDFQDRKLKMFKGTYGNVLKDFVEKYPDKKSYFELRNDVTKFIFPKPGALEGVKSRTKNIMTMRNVTYQYPTRDTPTIFDVNLTVNQCSRVAVIGPNGAGKTTAIKLLTQELKPNKGGKIEQHPSMRMAYVAQHAFHHLEKHLTKTPVQYILWRFAGNEDKESLEFKDSAGVGDEEEKLREVKWFHDPKQANRLRRCDGPKEEALAITPEALLKRRYNKKDKMKEYEVKWQYKSIEATTWETRDILVKMGYLKMVQRKDEQEAMAGGLMTKQLTQAAIEKHLGDFGVDQEYASHTLIQSLSGGQKVKVVLAASMWQNPHILILDEPTNYLDRDGLGALTHAIGEFEGGVIIISHNREFANAVGEEKWVMEAGHLRREGESAAKGEEEGQGNKEQEEIRDAAGNIIDQAENLAMKDIKVLKKDLRQLDKKMKDYKKNMAKLGADHQDDEWWEMLDKKDALEAAIAEAS
jgi:elongation factor 3